MDPARFRATLPLGPHAVAAPDCKVTVASPLQLHVGGETVEVDAKFVGVTPDGALEVDIELSDSDSHLAEHLRAGLDSSASIDFRFRQELS